MDDTLKAHRHTFWFIASVTLLMSSMLSKEIAVFTKATTYVQVAIQAGKPMIRVSINP